MKRPVCEDSLSIDVRRWRRDGLLPYQKFSCTWCSGDQALAGISVAIEADAVFLAKAGSAVLTFQWRRRETSEWTEACQRVPIAWTRCYLGGARPWFLCPAGAGEGQFCGRRVAELYANGPGFACRQCCGFAYTSQSESPHDRSIRRVRKTRMRLGGGTSIVDPFLGKPPRMHWRTYGRWLDRVEQEQEHWIGFSHDLLRRLRPGWEPPKRLTFKQELKSRLRQLHKEASFRTTTRTGHGPHGAAD
jgi:hypothetical protein